LIQYALEVGRPKALPRIPISLSKRWGTREREYGRLHESMRRVPEPFTLQFVRRAEDAPAYQRFAHVARVPGRLRRAFTEHSSRTEHPGGDQAGATESRSPVAGKHLGILRAGSGTVVISLELPGVR
jgi:hypothetical protein